MARKKKAPSGPNNGYLISFGDTMTALLAFFIVLNSLAKEQTGANLHTGTGSFQMASKGMGVPGLFPTTSSPYVAQMAEPSPIYLVGGGDGETVQQPSGPDKDGDSLHVADRERDELHRFLQKMDVDTRAGIKSAVKGEIAFDRLSPLNGETLFDEQMQADLLRLAPMLRRSGYELEVRVWATTPAPSAWERAAEQAHTIHKEMLAFLKLRPDEYSKLTASASPWISSTIKRPSLSFLVRRVQ